MYTKEQIRHIAEGLIDELREMPDGTRITSAQLLGKYDYELEEFGEGGLFDFHEALARAAKGNHITLDMSDHKDKLEGLLYNLDFAVRNKKAQIKCPHCGSKDTARILYGMPAFSDELQEKLDTGKIVLGGCCMTSINVNGQNVQWQPSRHCNHCRKDFGMPPVLKDRKQKDIHLIMGEDYRDIVESIRFCDGGYFSGYTNIEIKKNANGALVTFQSFPFGKHPVPDRQITALRWNRLVNKLYTELYLHEWKKKYNDPCVLDGEQWELTIKLAGSRKRSYNGSNAFPPYWPELKALFRPFGRG